MSRAPAELTEAAREELLGLKNLDDVKAWCARKEAAEMEEADRECRKTCKNEMCRHTETCWFRT